VKGSLQLQSDVSRRSGFRIDRRLRRWIPLASSFEHVRSGIEKERIGERGLADRFPVDLFRTARIA